MLQGVEKSAYSPESIQPEESGALLKGSYPNRNGKLKQPQFDLQHSRKMPPSPVLGAVQGQCPPRFGNGGPIGPKQSPFRQPLSDL